MEPKGSLLFGPNPEPDESSPHPFFFPQDSFNLLALELFFFNFSTPCV